MGALSDTQRIKYRNMKESNFFEKMNKAHPEWKVKSTLISKKKAYALQQAKSNTSYMSPKEALRDWLGEGNKAGKNKGKVRLAKIGGNGKQSIYIPDNKKSLTAHAKKLKEAKYKWLISRGKLKGLTTYDWNSWAGMFPMFQGGYGSGDAITTTGIKGYDKGTIIDLVDALASCHHGEKLSAGDKKTLKYWGLTKVKPVSQEKPKPKKKTTTRKRKAPAKKSGRILRGKRNSPSTSATSVNVGTKRRGGDGKLYVCKTYKRGNKRVKRWFKI